MRCINPITLKDDTIVPCGYCGNCVRRKQQDWVTRLQIEQFHSYSSHFVTLTYSDQHLPVVDGQSSLVKRDIQLWLKKLRKFQTSLFDGLEPIRYYMVGEYGERYGRAHYHCILFNAIPETVASIERIWGKGQVHIGTVTPASISYVTSYVITRYHYPGRASPFAVMSKKPGIGYQYLTAQSINFHNYGQIDFFSRDGVKRAMPRYYFDRLFDYGTRRSLRKRQLVDSEIQEERRVSQHGKSLADPWAYDRELNRYNSERVGSNVVYTY